EVELVARHDGEEVATATVTVAQPTELQVWPEGLDWLFNPGAYETRVVRLAGGTLDLHARYYVGETRYFGDGVLSFETELDAVIPASSEAGNVVRVTGEELGVATVRFDALGLRQELEVETVATVDALEVMEIGAIFVDDAADSW